MSQPLPKLSFFLGNGHCEQLCFTYPADAADKSASYSFGRTCECAFGSLVNERKCAVSKEYLVFSTRTELRSQHISRDGDEDVDSSNPFKGMSMMCCQGYQGNQGHQGRQGQQGHLSHQGRLGYQGRQGQQGV